MLWVGTYMGGLSYTPAHGSFFLFILIQSFLILII